MTLVDIPITLDFDTGMSQIQTEKQKRRRSIVNHLEMTKKSGVKRVLKRKNKLDPEVLPPNIMTATALSDSSLESLRVSIGDCQRCKLGCTRQNIVFGEGNPKATLMFVGEGPGADEDEQGRPFVGRAGQLLTKIIESMGLKREDVYIANVVKCRPPENRVPEPDEVSSCIPFLKTQIEIIKPKVIMTLGKSATQAVIGNETAISKLRGQFLDDGSGRLIMPTYHPAYLLRNPEMKKFVWEDCQKVMAKIGLKKES